MSPRVTDADVRSLQVLQAALAAGPVLLWGVVAALAAAALPAPEASDRTGLVVLLSAVHAFMAPMQWAVGLEVFRRGLRAASTEPLARLRGATIVRLALFEGAALLGAAIGVVAVTTGVAQAHPWVWLNALSTLALLALAATTWPTRERVEALVRGATHA